jgi:hypothetical protein
MTLPLCFPPWTVTVVYCVALMVLGSASARAGPPRDGTFRFADIDASSLGLWEGKRPVLVYNHGTRTKAGVPENRQRSSYVHPLYGLDGEVLTDDFPKDHYHHRGLFWAWPHVRVGTREYDLWMLRGIRHRFERWTERTAGRESAVLALENGWYVEDRRVVAEQVRFQVLPATAEERLIDIELRWSALDQPVALLGAANKSYGGLSLRFAPRKETTITTPDGVQKSDLNLTRLTWADLTGRFEGGPALSGIALFVDRRHPGFPPTWITRHYGFLGVGWPGIESFTLQPGQTIACKYRVLIHRGKGDVARLQKAFETLIRRK